ncbi:hypothetical protein [Protaetiibacter larvae]|uniref:Uncharacterized protein n=1 Tax=Protaetiibacter larvae TaxID=2592654 RepID=A0A5C1YC66_9MICO|nr:hypothetical protein [Protaetiibacter larvae]QEO10477.1 hypothetical protein FLP23_10955 [Protaetiibacter larvae]
MVAELLRLRLRILANGFRRPPAQLFALVLGLVVAFGGIVAAWWGAQWISRFDDAFVTRGITVVGSWLVLACFLVPAVAVRRSALSSRAFLGYGIPPIAVCLTLFAYAILGPGILLAPIAAAPVAAWTNTASVHLAWAAAPLLFLQGLISVKLGRQLGVAVRRHRRLAAWVDFIGVFTLVVGAALSVVTLAPRIHELRWLADAVRPFQGFLHWLPDWLATTPLGVLWAAPGWATPLIDEPETAWRSLGMAALLVVVLFVCWFVAIGLPLRATRRLPGPRRTRVPGWFARFPTTPTGAIAARSVSYWLRDPRYRAVFAVLPLVPVVVLVALRVGGVPFPVAVLVPLPLMTLLIAWSTIHNDVAYDNTAIWQHVAAQTRGVDDRRGRAIPVLIWGAVLLLVGVPLAVWGHGDLAVAPPLLGVCIALLLGGIGIGNLYSARFPYAAPRPGDAAWQAPQVPGSQGGVAQAISIVLVLATAAPAFAAAALWWFSRGAWGWVALGLGLLVGIAVYAIGVRGGGAAFERRGPELLAFTLRN